MDERNYPITCRIRKDVKRVMDEYEYRNVNDLVIHLHSLVSETTESVTPEMSKQMTRALDAVSRIENTLNDMTR